MVRALGNGIATSNSLPWFWTTPMTCPKCLFSFLLTPEDTMTGTVNQIGASAQLHLGWRQLVEGDPATVLAIDTAHLHVDPAQVIGQCPNCGYNPLVQRGPRYGTTKITLNTNPATTAIMDWMALGAQYVRFIYANGTFLVGILIGASWLPISTDPTTNYVVSVRRNDDSSLDATTMFNLAGPSIHVTADDARRLDSELVDTLVKLGLTLL